MLEDDDERAQLAAVNALSRFADAAAVEKLLPLTQSLFGGDLQRDAQAAITAIQSRLPGASAGQLSVSDVPSAAGSLSTPMQDGSLSEAETAGKPVARKTPA